MIKVETFPLGALCANTHLLYDTESKKCLIIDLGADFCEIEGVLSARGLKVGALLLTHGHFDHSFGAASASERGIDVYISEKDAYMLKGPKESLAASFDCPFEPCARFTAIREGVYEIGGFTVKAIETPGHTKGSVCYVIGDDLFSGDTLFFESYGRYDLPGGNMIEIVRSAKKLFALDNLTVYTGHDKNTTIEHERRYNPLSKYI